MIVGIGIPRGIPCGYAMGRDLEDALAAALSAVDPCAKRQVCTAANRPKHRQVDSIHCMDFEPSFHWRPLQEAVELWMLAVEDLNAHARRILEEERTDPVFLAMLRTDVELARLRCLRVSAAIHSSTA